MTIKQKNKTVLGPSLASNGSNGNGNGAPPHNNNSYERKIHQRSPLETLRLYILTKPQYLIRVTLFVVAACCSLSIAVRLQGSAAEMLHIYGVVPVDDGSSSASSNSRVLFQPPPPQLHFQLPHQIPKSSESSSSKIWEYYNYNNYNTRKPRMIGVFWPDDTDPLAKYLQQHNYDNNPKISNKLIVENVDPNMIRQLTARSLQLSKSELEGQLHLENSHDYADGAADEFETQDCKAQYDWQLVSYPTCNVMHEHPLWDMVLPGEHSKVKFLTNGYWRDVWMVRDDSGVGKELGEPLALKTIRYEHEYEERNYDRHRRDAVAMEHLTSSPNVIGIHGFCGNSGIFEYATGGSLEDAIWYSEEPEWNSTEKLIVAYQVATGIADLHNSDKEGQASIAHTDITPSQFVFVNKYGRFLLNDFNRCRFIRWNEKKQEACPFHVGSNPGTFRAPEEYAYEPETEKIDIYSMGNIFYALMMKDYPFHDRSKKTAQRKIMAGERPKLNETYSTSEDPLTQALIRAMNMCWIHNPKKRATARQVEQFIDSELVRLGVVTAGDKHRR